MRKELEIFGNDWATPDGTCIRDYVHVSDLAEAHVLAFEHLVKNKESFIVNLGSESGISVKTMVEKARQITGRPIPSVLAPRRKGDPEKLVASSKKAYELLGWKAKLSDAETLLSSTWTVYKNIKPKN
jgi:UDP-glucose 4-epimerase